MSARLAETVAFDNSARLITYFILVLAAVLVGGAIAMQFVRRRQEEAKRAAAAQRADDGRLSRSSAAPVNNPIIFGGGAITAAPTHRRETVTYGYLAVAEEYVGTESGTAWSVLSVTLPGWVPYLVVDHRSVLGTAGIPAVGGQHVATGDPEFDGTFVAVTAEADVVARVLVPAVRKLLAHYPVQRMSLSGKTLLLRTFDDNKLSDTVLQGLNLAAADLLATAPSFVMDRRPTVGAVVASLPSSADPLPQGFYGTT